MDADEISLSCLRERCDKYYDGRGFASACPAWATEFNVDKEEDVRDAAKLALNIYKQKEQKMFNLEKVCKLNLIGPYYCMTFRAKNAESDECRLFRGVVDGLSDTVLLCEIKEPSDIASLSDRVENYVEALSESEEDHSPCAWYNASTKCKRRRVEKDLGDDYAVGFVDVNNGSSEFLMILVV